jgi:glycine/D-amino acid oxidase-like deaminating enzyme
MGSNTFDVVVVGGGAMGSATAYYLVKTDPGLRVAVVERDPAYTRASTTLSLANVRIQFTLRRNVEISRYAFEVFARFDREMAVRGESPNLAFRREGNLFLVDREGETAARGALDRQRRLGCEVQWLSPGQIEQRFPLYRPESLVGGTFSPLDGHFDAYALLMAYKAKARYLGASFVDDDVRAVLTAGRRVTGVQLASGRRLDSAAVVNCAGAWAAEVACTAGVALPVEPVKRQVFAVDTVVKPADPLPLTILPSGLYFRSETGDGLVVGKSMVMDPVGFDFSWEAARFNETLWPELAAFVPAFDTLKLIRGWAGLYAVNTLDGNAILGEWPELGGFYLANGFSGHGLQQAPAVGRYLSECILGLEPALDLSIFGPERILESRPLSEAGLV